MQIEMKKIHANIMKKLRDDMVPTLVRLRKDAHWHKVIVHIQRVTLWCIAIVCLSHLHLELLCH
jgi:hypothetical protein